MLPTYCNFQSLIAPAAFNLDELYIGPFLLYELSTIKKLYTSFASFYTLLFHSLFKVKFNIDHFVLGEHRER